MHDTQNNHLTKPKPMKSKPNYMHMHNYLKLAHAGVGIQTKTVRHDQLSSLARGLNQAP